MPNFDGGHYFLSVLAPVRTDAMPQSEVRRFGDDVLKRDDDTPVSYADHLRTTLATLPTALQTPASEETGIQSPFALDTRTHLTRMVVIENPMYNGRDPSDAIVASLTGEELTKPQPVDTLSCPFLMWAVDFDPVDPQRETPDDPAAYLRGLWNEPKINEMLKAVFSHCVGFDKVKSADDFAAYIIACQLETTMPFNDYWTLPMDQLLAALPSMMSTFKMLAIPGGAAALALVGGLLGWIVCGMFGFNPLFGIELATWGWVTCGGAVVLALVLLLAYGLTMRGGAKPFPTAPNSDLPSILKAIYLQQKFSRFAIAQQGADADALYDAFGKFIDQHKPTDVAGPTQPAGVVRS